MTPVMLLGVMVQGGVVFAVSNDTGPVHASIVAGVFTTVNTLLTLYFTIWRSHEKRKVVPPKRKRQNTGTERDHRRRRSDRPSD